MFNIPKKVKKRLVQETKKFQTILANAKKQDLNEADTVKIITGIFTDMLGYDKYTEISAELNIKGTYCDLCIKLENKIQLLIEAKAVGLDLKAGYLKQAIDYAANKGIDWVLLTNGVIWDVYKVFFSKPLNQELVLHIDFSTISHKSESDINDLYILSREGMLRDSLDKHFIQKKALSKYYIGAIILNNSIINRVKRQIKSISPDVRVTDEQIREVIETEVFKREILESDKFKDAMRAVNRVKRAKIKAAKEIEEKDEEEIVEEELVEEEIVEKV